MQKNQYSHKSRIKVVSHKSCIESGWIEFLFTIYKSSRKGAQSRVVWHSVHCQEYCPANTIFNSSSSFCKMEWLININSIRMATRSEFNFRLLASWSDTTGLLWEQYAIHLLITVTLISSIRMHYIGKFQITRPWTFFPNHIHQKKLPQKFFSLPQPLPPK